MNDDSTTGTIERALLANTICDDLDAEKRIARLSLIELMINKHDTEESILDFFFMNTYTGSIPWKICPSRWGIVKNKFWAKNPYVSDNSDWRQIDVCELIDIEDKRHPLYKHIIRRKRKYITQCNLAALQVKK